MAADNTSWADFSCIENPFGTPDSFISALIDAAMEQVASLQPDTTARRFKRSLSSTLMIPEETILVGSTVSNMIAAAAQAFETGTVGIMVPCPLEYMLAVANTGHKITRISGISNFIPPAYSAISTKGESFNAVILANPGFPSSRLLPKPILESYLEKCDWVIVDEHAIELTLDGKTFVNLVEKHRNLIVVQSFCNQYALHGAPVSYLIAHPDIISEIERFYDLSMISCLPEVFAEPSAQEYPKLQNVRDFLAEEIPWMQTMLSLIPGITINPAEANYVMCSLNDSTSSKGIFETEDLAERLKDYRCIIRNLNNIPGIENSTSSFCVAVRTRQENLQLIEALRTILS